jgi:hypothetical protein
MKYSFYCKHCGYTFMSDSKEDVQNKKKFHKTPPVTVLTGARRNTCTLIPTGSGTIANPSLAEYIKNDRLRKAV